MPTNNKIPASAATKNLPGIPILPGRNTPFIQKGPPKNVPAAPSSPATDSQRQTKETK